MIQYTKPPRFAHCYPETLMYKNGVPLHAVGVTVAVVLRVHAVALQTASALLAAGLGTPPVRVETTGTGTAVPPAERRTL